MNKSYSLIFLATLISLPALAASQLPHMDQYKENAAKHLETCKTAAEERLKSQSTIGQKKTSENIGQTKRILDKLRDEINRYYDQTNAFYESIPSIGAKIKTASNSPNGETNLETITNNTQVLQSQGTEIAARSMNLRNRISKTLDEIARSRSGSSNAPAATELEKQCGQYRQITEDIRSTETAIKSKIQSALH